MPISDMRALRQWQSAATRTLLPSLLPPIEFALPHLSAERNRRLTVEMTRLRRACGCAASGFAMTIAFLLVAAALATDGRALAATPLLFWAAGFLFIAMAAAAGKLAGLLWARRQMVRLARSAGRAIVEE